MERVAQLGESTARVVPEPSLHNARLALRCAYSEPRRGEWRRFFQIRKIVMIGFFVVQSSCPILALSLLFRVALPLVAPFVLVAQVDVLTQHNDNARTGANLQEKVLTSARVSSGFGMIGEQEVDGDIYAQPLFVSKLHVKGLQHNVV